MLQIKQYVKVASLDEAYELNQKKNNVIIGGMHWLKMSSKMVGTAIDLSGLGLDKIVETDEQFEIGCMASLRDIECHEGLNAYTNNAVRDAVKDIVGVQFRNTATVGGSVFGRYGFSDILTIFLALDTRVVLHAAGELSLAEYAAMKPDRDIVVKLIVKKAPIKVAYTAQRRTRTDFPVLACAVSNMNGSWRAVVGARPARAVVIEDDKNILSGQITDDKAEEFAEYAASKLSFGTNMRGSAEYRQQICKVYIRRVIIALGGEQ